MPSIGNDLASIRSHMGYTLEDVQKATKIPLTTLQSIEDGTIFSDQKEINTYIRSFVRTYGRAIKLDDDLLSRALDQEELGSYNHLLLQNFPELRKKKGIDVEPEDKTESGSTKNKVAGSDDTDSDKKDGKKEESGKEKKKTQKAPTWTFESDRGDEPAPTAAKPKSPRSPNMKDVDWASMSQRRRTKSTQIPVWVISAGLIIILIIVAAILLTQFGLFASDNDNPDEFNIEEPSTGVDQNLSLDLSDQVPEDQIPAAVLDDTLYLTLYAAYNRLDPVRVWSDLKPRIDPYWLDQGVAYNYEFQDTIRVRGSYSNMLLFLNGNRIDNFRNQHFNEEQNAVELTRSFFDSDVRWATPVSFELPGDAAEPDTVIMRPTF